MRDPPGSLRFEKYDGDTSDSKKMIIVSVSSHQASMRSADMLALAGGSVQFPHQNCRKSLQSRDHYPCFKVDRTEAQSHFSKIT